MDCVTSTTEIGGATLVSVIVENPHDEPARYRLTNELDGPVWPPRRRGYPERGWDESGYEGVLGPGERDALGYAVPASPVDPPARIAWTEPAEVPEPSRDTRSTARSFRDPRPPRSVFTSPRWERDSNPLETGDRP
ncbi:DUF7857 domain-containing protein [Halodesulfurarchaeum sp.]|uniref:DUF7857 domain-containing protein n=1 Tax=Halodesulfurarchaeum sp. TaxID=1980530 RepID=UPI001BC215BD|nr:hypothetical protein [Halodesulfurarchaeum sp.]